MEVTTLGAGCFWCIEACYKELEGVLNVVPGYAGGNIKNPGYKEVCTGRTGHAEVAQIEFDPSIISFAQILEVFFFVHDPTSLNRQGGDVGSQYRSAVFYHSDEQKEIAEATINRLDTEKVWENPIVTEVTEVNNYYTAEDYHHNYLANNPDNPYCQSVVRPKLDKFKKVFSEKLKR